MAVDLKIGGALYFNSGECACINSGFLRISGCAELAVCKETARTEVVTVLNIMCVHVILVDLQLV